MARFAERVHRPTLRPATGPALVLALLLVALAGPARSQPAATPASVPPSDAAAAEAPQWGSGKELYDKVCGHCHKPEVGVGTVLEGRVLPPEYLQVIVRNGFNAMPAFPASWVDDAALAEISRYLGSLPPPPSPPAGGTP